MMDATTSRVTQKESTRVESRRHQPCYLILFSLSPHLTTMDGLSLLTSTTAGSLFPTGRTNIVYVSRHDPVSSAFQQMVDNKILSVPVYDSTKRCFTCFLDIIDVVAFSVKQVSGDQSPKDLTKLMQSPLFDSVTCGELSDISRRNPYFPVENTAPVLEALSLMMKWGVHRIPIVDAEGELITILSQSQLATYVRYKYLRSFNPILLSENASTIAVSIPVDENETDENANANAKAKCKVSVGLKDRAIDAFISMHDKKVSGVAVIDDDGKIVGNISASDLKTIGYDGGLIARLFYPVSEFLKLIYSHDLEASGKKSGGQHHPASVVKTTASFAAVIAQLVNQHIHRVYVVDDEGRPVGVIGHAEILRAALRSLQVKPSIPSKTHEILSSYFSF